MTPSTRLYTLRASRLVLAVAEHDEDAANAVLTETSAEPGGPARLIETLCGTIAVYMHGEAGSQWTGNLREFIKQMEAEDSGVNGRAAGN